ncbi:hypothetical protein J5T34_08445 [Cupriavidus gilardii]|uniref:hypothetical protein n=1 Tax=Cupriavidus gilardii TaxID=82541 RepID=UPI001ABEC493|nr:hypothetical protein [Cupriavidus gilardii]MBO4120768.1 hypothetical protein [Cupriavidus gilardii]
MSSAIQRAQQDTLGEILTWVGEVVEGRGDSIAQMIVTTVLGCIPFVGQAVDAYNILRCIWLLTRNARSTDNWIELVLSLIALVPGIGDALKNVFKALRNGKAMGRILDSLPRSVRGNIEDWFRNLNWASYTRELTRNVDDIFSGLINVLDRHVVEWVMGRDGVRRLVAQLNSLKRMAAQKINEAMDTLRRAHQQAVMQPLPSTTAHVPAAPRAPRNPTPQSRAPATVKTTTSGTAAPRTGQATATQRQSQRAQQSRSYTGVSGEHISDYYYVKRKRSRAKVSNSGVLYEMTQPGHRGIDHVWHSERLPFKYRISDTKGTTAGFHGKLETAEAVWAGLRYGIDAYLGEEEAPRARNALGRTVRDGRQLSHRWVAKKINSASLTPSAQHELIPAIEAWEEAEFKLSAKIDMSGGRPRRSLVRCPYDRSLITVVGPNHNRHKTSNGSISPRCCKPLTSHQIATEFVLPTTMLAE